MMLWCVGLLTNLTLVISTFADVLECLRTNFFGSVSPFRRPFGVEDDCNLTYARVYMINLTYARVYMINLTYARVYMIMSQRQKKQRCLFCRRFNIGYFIIQFVTLKQWNPYRNTCRFLQAFSLKTGIDFEFYRLNPFSPISHK